MSEKCYRPRSFLGLKGNKDVKEEQTTKNEWKREDYG